MVKWVLKLRICFLMMILAFIPAHIFAADAGADVNNIVQSYLASLSAGDVEGIKSAIGGALLERTTRTLSTGDKYGAFLRRNYTGVRMAINSVMSVADKYHAQVMFFYADGSESNVTFIVAMEQNAWRIVDEKL